jgi:hypothetical protein
METNPDHETFRIITVWVKKYLELMCKYQHKLHLQIYTHNYNIMKLFRSGSKMNCCEAPHSAVFSIPPLGYLFYRQIYGTYHFVVKYLWSLFLPDSVFQPNVNNCETSLYTFKSLFIRNVTCCECGDEHLGSSTMELVIFSNERVKGLNWMTACTFLI